MRSPGWKVALFWLSHQTIKYLCTNYNNGSCLYQSQQCFTVTVVSIIEIFRPYETTGMPVFLARLSWFACLTVGPKCADSRAENNAGTGHNGHWPDFGDGRAKRLLPLLAA